ncbi:hypothetical protein LINPERPRIM_LOCUS45327 [Linum perenne]
MSNYYATQVSLKLLIDKQTRKVVYAEAGKEFVDFILTILSLPLGTVTSLLSINNMIGCIGSLYHSVQNLESSYIIESPTQNRTSILNPTELYLPTKNTTLLPSYGPSGTRLFYTCPTSEKHDKLVTADRQAICPYCKQQMNTCREERFVKGAASYMIMDNLEVKAMSTVSIMAAFSRVSLKDVGALEEKVFKGLKILKASLMTQAVLSTVFLGA